MNKYIDRFFSKRGWIIDEASTNADFFLKRDNTFLKVYLIVDNVFNQTNIFNLNKHCFSQPETVIFYFDDQTKILYQFLSNHLIHFNVPNQISLEDLTKLLPVVENDLTKKTRRRNSDINQN